LSARKAVEHTVGGLFAATKEVDPLSKTVKHRWYGDVSPWSEQQLEDSYSLKGTQSQTNAKVEILDRENPPQPRSARAVESED
jgi:hypothetical protein